MLEIKALQYRHLGPFSFVVGCGHCTGLSGPSGAGKSLLLRALCDLDAWTGSITLKGISPAAVSAPAWRKRIGYMPSESHWWHETVQPHFNSDIGHQYLHQLGFEADVMHWAISRLSTGERQRLALLRLLSNLPEALLLDEPTAHLDRDMVSRAEHLISTYRQEQDVPVLWVSHDREQLSRVAESLLLLDRGSLVPEVAAWM